MTIFKAHSHIAIFLACCLISAIPAPASGTVIDLGVHGRTYGISEPDALNEIQDKAAGTDWSKVFDPEKMEPRLKNFKLESKKLPKAESDREFTVDMTYVLEQDIPDGQGNILYPAGYSFNPLEYTRLDNVIVVMDGSDPEQVAWYETSSYARDYRTMLLITDGQYYDLTEQLNTSVFYATARIIERFNLRAVPSVVYQADKYMHVKEININAIPQ